MRRQHRLFGLERLWSLVAFIFFFSNQGVSAMRAACLVVSHRGLSVYDRWDGERGVVLKEWTVFERREERLTDRLIDRYTFSDTSSTEVENIR